MNADRELLEMAAKAAGVELACYDEERKIWYRINDDPIKSIQNWGYGSAVFDPLDDDGDALRLAAALKIDIEWQATRCGAEPDFEAYRSEIDEPCFCAREHENNYRRAIVRAAAEIGRMMP